MFNHAADGTTVIFTLPGQNAQQHLFAGSVSFARLGAKHIFELARRERRSNTNYFQKFKLFFVFIAADSVTNFSRPNDTSLIPNSSSLVVDYEYANETS